MSEVDNVKIEVYNIWKEGKQSKASLALQFDTSPRTIGRWIDAVEESGYVKPVEVPVIPVVKKNDVVADTRYIQAYGDVSANPSITKTDLAKKYGVSTRTIGRWLERAEKEFSEPKVKGTREIFGADVGGEVVNDECPSVGEPVQYRYNASSKSISITQIKDGQVTGSVSTDKSVSSFEDILDALIDSNFSQEQLEKAFISLQPVLSLEKFSQGKLEIDPKNRKILYIENPDTVPYEVHNSLATRVIDLVRNGDSGVQTLLNFMEKLMENPSRRAVNELYGFLEANDIQIAEDGDFYAWKKVRSDYLDIHSGTMDNSVGTTPRVSRNMVDENSERTCSYGLHVCSKSYLPKFGSAAENRILKVKVNPADVVAIPKDYNNAKMRCAGYYVVEDVTNSKVWH